MIAKICYFNYDNRIITLITLKEVQNTIRSTSTEVEEGGASTVGGGATVSAMVEAKTSVRAFIKQCDSELLVSRVYLLHLVLSSEFVDKLQ